MDHVSLPVVVHQSIVYDGEVERPVTGERLTGLGLRLDERDWAEVGRPVTVTGVVRWVRDDGQTSEAVVECDGFSVLVTTPTGRPAPGAVGGTVRVRGHLTSIGPYEFDEFGLPDVTRDWIVRSVEVTAEPMLDFLVEIDPLD